VTGNECLSLEQHELISVEECAEIASRVIALKAHWAQRSAAGFFTLGTAWYLHTLGGRDTYLKAAKSTNQMLKASFEDLHESVRRFFPNAAAGCGVFR
jgi:hypothetical protein